MHDFSTQKYTVGFIFDASFEHILLVHKQKPDWQKGKVNAVGGKYEDGESSGACTSREVQEETSLTISEDDWTYFGTIKQPQGDVGLLAAVYDGDRADAVSNDHEEIEWFPVHELPVNVMPNLHWFVPLALAKLTKSEDFQEVTLQY